MSIDSNEFEDVFNDSLFEEIFSNLINESKNLIIELKHCSSFHDDLDTTFHSIVSVNNCPSENLFMTRLLSYSYCSFNILKNKISTLASIEKVGVLINIKFGLQKLIDIVSENIILNVNDVNIKIDEEAFYTFNNCKIKGIDEEQAGQYRNYILYCANGYANVWVNEIDSLITKIDFLTTNFELLPEYYDSLKLNPITKHKIKTNLSVPQLSCFFRILYDNNLIKKNIKTSIRIKSKQTNIKHMTYLISEYFQTRGIVNQSSNNQSSANIKNNFDIIGKGAALFWEKNFQMMKKYVSVKEKNESVSELFSGMISFQENNVDVINEKIRTNLNIPQLVCLFRILYDYELIFVNNNDDLIILIENFQTIDTISNVPISFRENFINPDLSTLEFWNIKFHDLLQSAQKYSKK